MLYEHFKLYKKNLVKLFEYKSLPDFYMSSAEKSNRKRLSYIRLIIDMFSKALFFTHDVT